MKYRGYTIETNGFKYRAYKVVRLIWPINTTVWVPNGKESHGWIGVNFYTIEDVHAAIDEKIIQDEINNENWRPA